MTTEELRAAIEAALRRRDPVATVRVTEGLRDDLAMSDVRVVGVRMRAVAPASLDALRALAIACGLRDDGSDPAEEVERLRAVVAGDPTRRMIRTEDVARALWPFVYAGRRDAYDDEGFGPRFDDIAQTAQDLFCALIDEAMQTMGAAIKRDPAEEDRRAVAAAWMFDAFAARGKRITELAAELAEARAALRHYGPRCIVCDAPATRRYFSSPACDDDNHLRAVRSPAADRLGAVATETEHADALRAAVTR